MSVQFSIGEKSGGKLRPSLLSCQSTRHGIATARINQPLPLIPQGQLRASSLSAERIHQPLPPPPPRAMGAIPFEQRLQEASAQNTRLLKTLSDTDYATSALEQSSNYIKSLKNQIAGHESRLQKLKDIVAKEYNDHKKYRDYHVKRVGYWLSGGKDKFQEKASKEEQEWLEAVQKEIQARKELDQLKTNLGECQKTNEELQRILKTHQTAKSELNSLYDELFQGPTPSLLGEDEKEAEVQKAEQDFNVIQMHLSNEEQVGTILFDAHRFMKGALDAIQEAERASTADLWGVGGTFSEMAERSALSQAQSYISQVEMLVAQAKRLQPVVNHIGEVQIAKQNLLTDVFFDNVFTDFSMREKVRESQEQLYNSQRRLTIESNRGRERFHKIQSDLSQAKLVLEERRTELQQIRASAFERLSGTTTDPHSGQPLPQSSSSSIQQPPEYQSEAPPSYAP